MKTETMEAWHDKIFPRRAAALKRQAATHERASLRKQEASNLLNKPTRKQLQRQRALAAGNAKKKARRDRHARKLARV